MKRSVILTGAELRHDFFRTALAASPHLHVLNSYCENRENDLQHQVEADPPSNSLRLQHLEKRAESEQFYFRSLVNSQKGMSKERHD